jgi:hypothetical protein
LHFHRLAQVIEGFSRDQMTTAVHLPTDHSANIRAAARVTMPTGILPGRLLRGTRGNQRGN